MDMMHEITFDNDRPACFSDAIFQSSNEAETCILCTSSNNDERGCSIIEELKKIDDRLIGKVSDKAIFCLMAEWYEENVKKPQMNYDNNANVLDLTPEICKRHFTYHDLNPKRVVKDDIQFICQAQTFLKENGVLKQNVTNGAYSINTNYVKQWNLLSKTKLDLLRYYKNEFSNETIDNGNSNGPHQFSSF